MNQKLNKVYTLFGVVFLAVIFSSYHTNPPSAATGAPGELTCTLCHEDLSNPHNFSGTIDILNFPSTIAPNTTYNLQAIITATGGNPFRAGFQAVALDGNELNAGDFSTTDPNVTTMVEWGKEYVEHNPVHEFELGNTVSYNFDWTAPDVSDGEVITIYTAACFGNDNGANTGDLTITNSFSGTVSSSMPPTVLVSSSNVSCFGGNNGSATAMVSGGNPTYTYSWSNGITDATILNLIAGIYTVTVADNNSLTSSSVVMIEEPAEIELTVNNVKDETGIGNADGEIDITIIGGIPPYLFSWTNDNGDIISTDEDLTQLSSGNYIVNITDQNGCVLVSSEIAIDIMVANEDFLLEKNITLFPNPTKDYLILEFDLSSSLDVGIMIQDNLGKVLLRKNVMKITQGKLELDVSRFSSGLYFLNVNSEENGWVRKFIVE